MTDIEWSERAVEQLEELEPDVQDRVVSKLEEATEWTEHRLDPLSNYPYHKLRAGDYRVILNWDKNADALKVKAVGHRRNVYKRNL